MILSCERKNNLDSGFTAAFGSAPQRYFSAPGRTEIGGNHTDHQQGRVLAAAVNLDTLAAVALNGSDTIRIHSEGFSPCAVNLNQLDPASEEINTTAALPVAATSLGDGGKQDAFAFNYDCLRQVMIGYAKL